MKVLAVDASSDLLSLAVGESVGARCARRRAPAPSPGAARTGASLSARRRTPGRHDEALWPMARRLLARAGWSLRDLDLLVAASGPGSFTGVRVGMTFVAVLAAALERPAVAVTGLEACAEKARGEFARDSRDRAVGVVYPGRGEEFYFQAFELRGRLRPLVPARRVAPTQWPEALFDAAGPRSILLTGPAAEAASRSLGPRAGRVEVRPAPGPGAEDLIAPALARVSRGSPGAFAPLYLQPAYYERTPD